LASALTTLLADSARASEGPASPSIPADDDHVSLETGMYVFRRDSDTWLVLTPHLGASYAPIDELVLRLEWGMAWSHDSTGASNSTQPQVSNPAVSGSYRFRFACGRLLLGAGIALPFVGPGAAEYPRAAAVAMSGLKDYWWWSPSTLTVFAPARWDMLPMAHLRLSADGALAIYIATSDSGFSDVALQVGGEAAYVHGKSSVGLRLQVVVPTLSNPGTDNIQVAVVPQGRLDLGPAYLTARFVINVHGPAGVSFDYAEYWGLFVGGGFYL